MNKKWGVSVLVLVGVLAIFSAAFAKKYLPESTAILKKSWGEVWQTKEKQKPAGEIVLNLEPAAENHSSSSSKAGVVSSPVITELARTKIYAIPEKISEKVSATDMGTVKLNSPEQKMTACEFQTSAIPEHKVIFNEIAWMGMTAEPQEEWVELKNLTSREISLEDWQIKTAEEKWDVILRQKMSMPANGFLVLGRGKKVGVEVGLGALSNSGMKIGLFDNHCVLQDMVDAREGWEKLGGDNEGKKTLERNKNDFGWHTSLSAGGTPGQENSEPPIVIPPATTTPEIFFRLVVSKSGGGAGGISSQPSGIQCGVDCQEEYLEGEQVVLTAQPEEGSVFEGWSGDCFGTSECRLTMTENLETVASFGLVPSEPTEPTSTQPEYRPVIAAIQITGGSGRTNNDFVRVCQSGSEERDISGWKLRKRTQSGTESSIKVLPEGSRVGSGRCFVWANSEDGFAESIGADTSSTATLAANNSAGLLDLEGNLADAVAWGSGHTDPFVEGSAFPQNPEGGQVLTRKSVDSIWQDTGNNVEDFEIK